jgi:tRNA(Ile2) C34 agmatinyltransferase TiaS
MKHALISDLKSIAENETYADMKQALLDLINELEEKCWCPHCGEEMDCYSHFCKKCKQRVATPDEY